MTTEPVQPTTAMPPRRKPGRPRNTDSEATKLSILEAAIEAFGAGGFTATSSQTIARAAGRRSREGTIGYVAPNNAISASLYEKLPFDFVGWWRDVASAVRKQL